MPRSDTDHGRVAPKGAIVRTPLRQRLLDLRGGPFAATGFLGAAFVLWWLLAVKQPPRTFVALVRGEPIIMRTSADHVVTHVFVELHQHVAAGAPLCAFDARRVTAAIAVARAEVQTLRAEVEGERARMQFEERRLALGLRSDVDRLAQQHAIETRQLELTIEEHRLARLEVEADVAALEVDRRRYEVRLAHLSGLVGEGLTPASEYAELGERIAALADQRVRLEALASAEREAEELAALRLREWRERPAPEAGSFDVALEAWLEPLQLRIDTQLAVLASLEVEAQDLVLHAPFAGRVERLLLHVGLRTVAGEELVALVADGPPRADLFVPEFSPERFAVGNRLELVDPLAPDVTYEGEILSVGPRVVELPPRLWNDPARPEQGFVCVVALPETEAFTAGVRLAARRAPTP